MGFYLKMKLTYRISSFIIFMMEFLSSWQPKEVLLSTVKVRPVNHLIKTQDTERLVHYNFEKREEGIL
jgi:hypothetical protein